MRCTNCGWPNPPQATKCAKCGSVLTSTPVNTQNNNVTPQNLKPGDAVNESQLNKTVYETQGGGQSGLQQPTQAEVQGLSTCPKCGYPLRSGISNCPNCNFLIGEGLPRVEVREEKKPETPVNHRPTNLDAATQNSQASRISRGAHGGTVNPYMMNYQEEPAFTLKPLKRYNERHELEMHEYEGSETVLNRDNTEPGNGSITSKEQAVITHEGDCWFIEDRSEQKTTFIQCGNKHQLRDGDLILLGNRLFEFHEC